MRKGSVCLNRLMQGQECSFKSCEKYGPIGFWRGTRRRFFLDGLSRLAVMF